MANYYEGQKVERFLKHTMDELYARTILESLDDVMQENCHGCKTNHPSCHTKYSRAEHLETYFDLIFNRLVYEDIVTKLRHEVEIADMPEDYKNNVFEQIDDWCKQYKINPKQVWFTTARLRWELEDENEDDCWYYLY